MSATTATKKSTNVSTARLVAHYNSAAAALGKNPKSTRDALRLLSRKNRYGVVAVGIIVKLL